VTDVTSLSPLQLTERRERVFLVLAGVFLSAMTLLNVIGITKFVQLGPLAVAVGVLPYPITFLCTDLISELYGKSRANFLVTVGLFINGFILLIMTAGQYATSVDPANMPPWQILQLAQPIPLPSGDSLEGNVELFTVMYAMTSGAVTASMAAYITAQYCDVQLFHFWKRVTKGKHLWLRNNFSTLLSQLVDSVMVVTVTFGAVFLRGEMAFQTLLVLVASNYGFKAAVALLDTIPLYILVARLRRYLALSEHELAMPEANGQD
jgi:uncharacterized PurR-regulated membrane protein YhhQ (DUF165 family)